MAQQQGLQALGNGAATEYEDASAKGYFHVYASDSDAGIALPGCAGQGDSGINLVIVAK